MFQHGSLVFGVVAPAENPPEDFGVERLEPSVHHLGESGVRGNLLDRETLLGEKPGRASGAEDLYTGFRQGPSEPGQPHLITDADYGPPYYE